MDNKQRLTMLTDLAEVVYLEKHTGDLGVPHVIRQGNGQVWADAFELCAWRALCTKSVGSSGLYTTADIEGKRL